jgi:hypothetical protein
MLVLLGQWAHNVLIWARRWLASGAPRLAQFGIVRVVQEVWAVPGRVQLAGDHWRRVRLNPAHPQASAVCQGLRLLLPDGATLGFLG